MVRDDHKATCMPSSFLAKVGWDYRMKILSVFEDSINQIII